MFAKSWHSRTGPVVCRRGMWSSGVQRNLKLTVTSPRFEEVLNIWTARFFGRWQNAEIVPNTEGTKWEGKKINTLHTSEERIFVAEHRLKTTRLKRVSIDKKKALFVQVLLWLVPLLTLSCRSKLSLSGTSASGSFEQALSGHTPLSMWGAVRRLILWERWGETCDHWMTIYMMSAMRWIAIEWPQVWRWSTRLDPAGGWLVRVAIQMLNWETIGSLEEEVRFRL